ncbi:uncharacterized protein LOC141895593 isoform X1 [Acropora palmata]|uniref:uncharacterized protein LOC141895593 isoform X1 n=1 Tax=Acropora palmata TaxID=6131 RepID=UPI003DA0147A
MFSYLLSFLLMLLLVSGRPSPELSLEDIAKELEELTKKTNNEPVSEKKATSEVLEKPDLPKELSDLAREASKSKHETVTMEKSVAKTEQQKDAKKTSAQTRTVNLQLLPKKSQSKPIPYRRPTQDHRTFNYDYPAERRPDYTYRKSYDEAPITDDYNENQRRFSQASRERALDAILRKIHSSYQNDPHLIRGGFLQSANENEDVLRRTNTGKLQQMPDFSTENWLPESRPVKIPEVIPPPIQSDSEGMKNDEERKRYLMDLLGERIKSRVVEAQKRGQKVPDKLLDFLLDDNSRRGMAAKADKSLFSH